MDKHQHTMARNPRTQMVMSSWFKKTELQRSEVLDKAQQCLDDLEIL
jgi:deoxyribodipyrimidine photolyase-like uncharacterized protein